MRFSKKKIKQEVYTIVITINTDIKKYNINVLLTFKDFYFDLDLCQCIYLIIFF